MLQAYFMAYPYSMLDIFRIQGYSKIFENQLQDDQQSYYIRLELFTLLVRVSIFYMLYDHLDESCTKLSVIHRIRLNQIIMSIHLGISLGQRELSEIHDKITPLLYFLHGVYISHLAVAGSLH